jgi:hypothetical protein
VVRTQRRHAQHEATPRSCALGVRSPTVGVALVPGNSDVCSFSTPARTAWTDGWLVWLHRTVDEIMLFCKFTYSRTVELKLIH